MAEEFSLSVLFKVIDQATAPLKKMGVTFDRLGKRIRRMGKDLNKVGKDMTAMGRKLSLAITVPLTGLGIFATKVAVDFEQAFTGVRKTVDATEEEFAKLQKGFVDMSKVVPLAIEQLFGVGEAAGQLGIENKNILTFSRTMADLGITTNLSAQEAATALARLANITQMPQRDFDRLGSTIVELGNNLATTEAEIVAMGLRLAGAGKQVGLTEPQILGLAGALSSVGIRAEQGGTAFSRVMIGMNKAVALGGREMAIFSKVAGKAPRDFRDAFKKDAIGILINFIEGLKDMSDEGKNVSLILDALGFEGIRVADSLLRASGAGDLFRRSTELGTKAWEENTALVEEAEKRYKTMGSQFRIAWNRIRLVAKAFGDILAPVLLDISNFLLPILERFGRLGPLTKKIIIAVAALAAALGPVLVAFGIFVAALGAISASTIAGTVAAIAGAFIGLGAAILMVLTHWKELKSAVTSGEFLDVWLEGMNKLLGRDPLRNAPISVPVGGVGMAPQTNRTDVNINLQAEEGTSAVISGIKNKGNSNTRIKSEGFVGSMKP